VIRLKHYLRFVLIWLANSLLVYIAFALYPSSYALGTAFIPAGLAPFVAGLLLTLICRLGKILLPKIGIELKGRYAKFLYYWLVNSAAVWIIARFAPYTGFGIAAYYWALLLGFFTSLVQWLLRQAFKRSNLI
jgi:uncharacterized membrane protein YvlD (DUF360 family)